MNKWRAYPKYRDSEVGWLGDSPEGWAIERLRFHTRVNPPKSEINRIPVDTNVSFVPMEAVGAYGGLSLDQEKPIEEVFNGYTYFRDGDVLVAKITPCFENGKGSIAEGLENGVGFGTTELHVLRPTDDLDCGYLFYVTISHGFRNIGAAHMYGAGGQKRVPDDFVSNFRHPIPPLEGQRTIATFLDRETSRIDALIAKKQRQIELLQEKRSALISHAVTKGLDPNVKMKDSGIEWLGEIPEHWGICLLKRVMNIAYGVGGELDRTLSEGIPILSLPNVTIDGNLELEEVPFTELSVSQRSEFLLRKGDLLFNWRNGSSNHLGKTAYFDLGGEYTHVSFLLRLRCDHEKNNSRYFHHLLNGLRITGFFSSSKAGVNNTFNLSELSNLWVILPPVAEQRSIAAFLDRETMRIEGLITRVNRSISLLREYRTALISAAVTGKIDVRDNCQ